MSETFEGPRGGQVLIVDDTPANIDILDQILEPEGYTVSVASSGEAALKLVSRALPDLILLDVMMPGIDGFETCRRLKSDEASREVPIIFITAKNETEDIVRGFSLGAVDYITKPFRHEEVCTRIRFHLQLKQLMKQLAEKNQKLVELNDLKNKFLGMAAHDLRNPLTSIQGYSKLLLDEGGGLPEETRKEFLEAILQVSQNMLTLLSDLLDISVIESGKLELKLLPGSLQQLVRERVRLHAVMADKKKLNTHLRLADLPDFLFDANRISQVLDNLISNAIKYSPEGKNIYLTLEKHGSDIQFSVRDEGPGISEEDQTLLFQHFQKLHSKPTGDESSHGLGLAIAKKMIEAHQGRLQVESRLGEGATFCFEIPFRKDLPEN